MNANRSLLTQLSETFDEYRADQRRAQAQGIQPQPGRIRRCLRWLTPNGGTLLLVAVLVLTTNVWAKPLLGATSAPGPSAIPASGTQAATVNYQGRLANSGGTPINDTVGMSFSLWDAATDGSLVWGPEVHVAVPVSEGLSG